jgi:hypothetical protein
LAQALHTNNINKPPFNTVAMNKFFITVVLLISMSAASAQAVGSVFKKTKQFYVPSGIKDDYRFFGYEFPSNNARKLICFSSHRADVNDNYNKCPLGSYYDTNRMKPGDNISFIGEVRGFGKMLYVSAAGKKMIFYLQKSNYTIK